MTMRLSITYYGGVCVHYYLGGSFHTWMPTRKNRDEEKVTFGGNIAA